MREEGKRVQLSISVSSETREWLREAAEQMGERMGVVVDSLVQHYQEWESQKGLSFLFKKIDYLCTDEIRDSSYKD